MEKIKVWRKQLLCVGIGMFLVLLPGSFGKAGSCDKGRKCTLNVRQQMKAIRTGAVCKGTGGKRRGYSFDLRSIQNIIQKEEAYNLYIKKYWTIPEMIRGENISINEVQHLSGAYDPVAQVRYFLAGSHQSRKY